MNSSVAAHAERVGPAFSVDGMLLARRKTQQVLRDISGRIEPGMFEGDAVSMAKNIISDAGLGLSWHPPRVRFGANTSMPITQVSIQNVVLHEDDIFFLDIAPRLQAWEADGGVTYTIGKNKEYQRCARDAEILFHEVRAAWSKDKLTGQELYAYGKKTACSMGWDLSPDAQGHRISDFPHATIYTGSLATFEVTPSTMRWILEIHILDPQKRFGAFYEDMLLGEEYYR